MHVIAKKLEAFGDVESSSYAIYADDHHVGYMDDRDARGWTYCLEPDSVLQDMRQTGFESTADCLMAAEKALVAAGYYADSEEEETLHGLRDTMNSILDRLVHLENFVHKNNQFERAIALSEDRPPKIKFGKMDSSWPTIEVNGIAVGNILRSFRGGKDEPEYHWIVKDMMSPAATAPGFASLDKCLWGVTDYVARTWADMRPMEQEPGKAYLRENPVPKYGIEYATGETHVLETEESAA